MPTKSLKGNDTDTLNNELFKIPLKKKNKIKSSEFDTNTKIYKKKKQTPIDKSPFVQKRKSRFEDDFKINQ